MKDPEKIIKRLTNPKRYEIESPAKVWEILKKNNPQIILEIGAGTGFYTVEFAKRGPEELKIIACDILKDLLKWLFSHISKDLKKKILPVLISDLLPIKEGSVDLVFMGNLHHELDDRIYFLKKVKKTLKEGGTIAILDWKDVESPIGPPLKERLKKENIEKDLKKANFFQITYFDIFPYHHFFIAQKE